MWTCSRCRLEHVGLPAHLSRHRMPHVGRYQPVIIRLCGDCCAEVNLRPGDLRALAAGLAVITGGRLAAP